MSSFRKEFGDLSFSKPLNEQSSLEIWYESVMDVPFDELTIEDLCRAIRQELCLAKLLPKALVRLRQDILAGEFYDGELLNAVASLPSTQRSKHLSFFRQLKSLLDDIVTLSADENTLNNIIKLRKVTP